MSSYNRELVLLAVPDSPAGGVKKLLPEIGLANPRSRSYRSENARDEPQIGSRGLAYQPPRFQIVDCSQSAQEFPNTLFILKNSEHRASRMHCKGCLDIPLTVLPLSGCNEQGQQIVGLFRQACDLAIVACLVSRLNPLVQGEVTLRVAFRLRKRNTCVRRVRLEVLRCLR